jgi:hypothetical protein
MEFTQHCVVVVVVVVKNERLRRNSTKYLFFERKIAWRIPEHVI